MTIDASGAKFYLRALMVSFDRMEYPHVPAATSDRDHEAKNDSQVRGAPSRRPRARLRHAAATAVRRRSGGGAMWEYPIARTWPFV